MSKTTAIALGVSLFLASSVAAAHTTEVLQRTGDSSSRIDLVILGDGYRSQDYALFKTDATNVMNSLFNATTGHRPFSQYGDFFNVKIIYVDSNETGADGGSAGGTRDTALGAYYGCNFTDRLLCVSTTAVNTIVQEDAPEADDIFVVVNDSKYGGSGGSVVVASSGAGSIEVGVHELAHHFSTLADEYTTAYPSYGSCSATSDCKEANVTLFATNRDAVKWNAWIETSTTIPTPDVAANYGLVGAFEGARYQTTGVWRPAHNCQMRTLGVPFCSVCAEAIALGVYHRGVSLVDSAVPAGPVAIGSNESVEFAIKGPRPNPNTLTFDWSIDGNTPTSNNTGKLTLTGADFGTGNHTLSVSVRDGTVLVRRDPENLLKETHTWTVTTVGAVTGFPTADGGDGKFVTLTGSMLETTRNQRTQFLIGVPAGQSVFNVQVFDGDQGIGSQYDTNDVSNLPPATVRTCFDLYSSADKVKPDSTTPTVRLDSSTLPDAQWGNIYNGNVFGQSSGSNAHFYILDTYMTDGACSGGASLVPVTGGTVNSFKIRATGQVSTVAADFSFLARDLDGPFAVGSLSPNTEMPDTNYDGQFSFFVDVGSSANHMTLRDADADIMVDDDPAVVGQRGPLDVKADGVATGRSSDIQYQVFSPGGSVALSNTNPSGNNNGVDVFDTEEQTVDVTGKSGVWEWRWNGVHVENNVRVWAPLGSPVRFELAAYPMARLSPSGAKTRSSWTTTVLRDLVPVTIGTGNNQITLHTVSDASALLGGAQNLVDGGACGASTEGLYLMTSLAGELLAAKLNIAQGKKRCEDLLAGYVYGRMESVAGVVQDGNAALRTGQRSCTLSAEQTTAIQQLLILLRAVNQGEVTFAAPVAEYQMAPPAGGMSVPGPGASRGM